MPRYITRETPGVIVDDNEPGAWKLDVGNECNLLLDLADQMEADDMAGHTTAALRSIVARVAEFEDLEVAT